MMTLLSGSVVRLFTFPFGLEDCLMIPARSPKLEMVNDNNQGQYVTKKVIQVKR